VKHRRHALADAQPMKHPPRAALAAKALAASRNGRRVADQVVQLQRPLGAASRGGASRAQVQVDQLRGLRPRAAGASDPCPGVTLRKPWLQRMGRAGAPAGGRRRLGRILAAPADITSVRRTSKERATHDAACARGSLERTRPAHKGRHGAHGVLSRVAAGAAACASSAGCAARPAPARPARRPPRGRGAE